MTRLPTVTIVMPAHTVRPELTAALDAIAATTASGWDLLVVYDGDERTDGDFSAVTSAAAARGGRTVRTPRTSGPAAARNRGAQASHSDLILFIDSDVCVRPDTVLRVQQFMAAHPDVAAIFGSYDDEPAHRGFASQFKNLSHHFVHQQGQSEASTFWAGCGAIRRDVFLAVGGFDERYERPCIEDIELGYRLRAAGHRIVLHRDLQVTHLKHWTLTGLLHSDLFDRGVPWVRLALRTPAGFVGDLNLAWRQRLCVALAWVAGAAFVLALWQPAFAIVGIASCSAVIAMNARFFTWLTRARGPLFALAAMPLHLLYHASNGLAVLLGVAAHALSRPPAARLVQSGHAAEREC